MPIPTDESLTVEFKSDRKGLPDQDLVEALVALANSEGGELWLGVEDNGDVTGVTSRHQNPVGLMGMVANNRTNPSLSVRCESFTVESNMVLRIEVPKMRYLVATSNGRYLRRRLKADGKPEEVPILPHELIQRQVTLSQLDVTAHSVPGATLDDFDPLEKVRLRRIIERFQGDRSLLALGDEELEGALGLVTSSDGSRRPTLTGLLIIGKEERLRDLLPCHEVAFQVLDGTSVRTNNFFHAPLLRVFEEVEAHFEALSAGWGTDEFEDGLFRISVPRYEKRAFREAFLNAVIHRDYTRLGAVHVRFEDFGLTISNPGGFVEGVTLENLLTVEPRPRNPRLADVMKRLGPAERTGRGVDRIFEGLLRFGRPEPDYSRTDTTSVIVTMANAAYDAAFLRMILWEEERRGESLPIDSLLLLAQLRKVRRLSAAEMQAVPLTAQFHSRGTLEKLLEGGLLEAHGSGRGRTYTLSAKVYRAIGERAEYVRQAGFDTIQQEQMVLKFVEKHGQVTRREVVDLCRITKDQATRLLRRLTEEGHLRMDGANKGAFYKRGGKI